MSFVGWIIKIGIVSVAVSGQLLWRRMYMTRLVVTYDIADPKRLYRTFQCLRKYGDHLQLSVFECWLEDKDVHRLKQRLRGTIDSAKDQILFIRIAPDGSSGRTPAVEALGLPYTGRDRVVTVL